MMDILRYPRIDALILRFILNSLRPALVLEDVRDADFHHDKAEKAASVPIFVLRMDGSIRVRF
jgi:hypothetical protein